MAGELSACVGLLETDLQGVPAGSISLARAVPRGAGGLRVHYLTAQIQPCVYLSNSWMDLNETLQLADPGRRGGAPSTARLYLAGGKQQREQDTGFTLALVQCLSS